VEAEVVERAEILEVFPGVEVPVAPTGALLALKVLAADDVRPLDMVDARALLQVATRADLELASALLDLIVARGAARGRDLRTAWAELTRPG
jgi:hypothetical protein